LIKQSGALQATAFLRRNATGFVDDLASVCRDGLSGEALIRELSCASLPDYLALSRDLIDVAVWFRRFAQSELKAEEA
jgi:hypothetical protein